jgi:peptidoglycan/LPS O-acetylase OafA/YrhL
MSHEPHYNPPPPSMDGTPKPAILFGIAGIVLASFVLYALNESRDRDTIIQTGAFLITLGIVFGAGLISRSEIVQLITAGIMMFGGGIAIGLGIRNDQAFWYVGGALFFACAVMIVVKDQIVDRLST